MSLVSKLWDRLVAAIEGEATTVEATLTEVEQKYAPAFGTFCHQVATVLKGQALTILEDGITAILATVASGGNIGAAIAVLVPQVVAQAKADASADLTNVEQVALNAAHTAIGLAIASAPAAAIGGASTDAPNPAPESAPVA